MRYGISTTWLLSLLPASKDECVHSVPDISDYCPTVQISLPVPDSSQCETKCPVCLGECKKKSYIKDCMHFFCFACISQWTLMVETCPVCKAKASSILHSATSPVEYRELHVASSPNKETGRQFYLCQGAVLEMFSLMEKEKLKWQSTMVWLRYYYGSNVSEICPTVQSITSRVKLLQKKSSKAIKG